MIALSPLLQDTNLKNTNARINTSSLEQMDSSPMHLHYCPFIMGNRFRDLIPGGGFWLLDNRAGVFSGGKLHRKHLLLFLFNLILLARAHGRFGPHIKGCACFFFSANRGMCGLIPAHKQAFCGEGGVGMGSPEISPCQTICLCLPPGGLTEMASQHVCAPPCGCWFLLLIITTCHSDIYCLYFSLAGSWHPEIRKGFDCDTIIDASQSLKMFYFYTWHFFSLSDD